MAAAREVLTATPGAPMAEIARRAGVGIGTLYRRYPSKEALVQQLCLDGMQQLEAAARAALDQVDEDAWEAFTGFMTAGLAAGAGSLGAALAGTFTPSDELLATAQRLYATVQELLERSQAGGAVRADITQEDVTLIFEQLRAVDLGDAERVASLQRRYLALALPALRAPGAAPLPGPPPGWDEIRRRWMP
jgi:AcrR family transcriptional regulator